MKRIVVSVGLAALGASSLIPQQAVGAESPAGKPWNASLTLRGFYDDNINTSPTKKLGSFGFEASPSVGVRWSNDQTTLFASYTYSFIDYEKRPAGNSEKYDQVHTISAGLEHAFTERYSVRLRDSFVVGQQPDTLRAGNTADIFYRVPGNNIVNYGAIAFNAQLTPLLGLELGYDNAWYDYADDFSSKGFVGPTVIPQPPPAPPIVIAGTPSKNLDAFGNVLPSNSGALDRVENRVHLDTKWQVMPATVAILGYQYAQVNYTADEFINGNVTLGPSPQRSSIRDSRSHSVYAGLDHSFRPDLTGSVRAGVTYYDYFNDPRNTTSLGPTALAVLSYTYAPESYLRVGFQEGRTASSLTGGSGQFVHDTETSVAYASLSHRILPHLYGGLKGTFQNVIYNGGGPALNNKSEQFYIANLDLEYRFSSNFSAHAGYDYDRLVSELKNRDYDRNKVYLGVTASY